MAISALQVAHNRILQEDAHRHVNAMRVIDIQ